MSAKIEQIAYGSIEALNAEFGTPDYGYGKFASAIIGDGDWDADYFDTMAEAKVQAKHDAETFGVIASGY